MAMIINPDFTNEIITDFGLDELQAAVGGLIEPVTLEIGYSDETGYSHFAYVNEEGLLLGLPVNEMASIMAGKTIVGPMVILNAAEYKKECEG